MSIQLSVILWTIICFVLLMLILRNLLFKPLLDCMDKRNRRITDAKEKQKRDAEHAQLELAAAEQRLSEQNAQAKAEAERKVAEEQVRASQAIDEQTRAEQAACSEYEAQLAEEKKALCEQTEQEVIRLSEIYASGFVS